MDGLTKIIDKIVAKQAEAASMLMYLLVIIMVMEVCLRYFFKSPTVWALELTTFLYGMHFVLGYGYTELFHGHVNVNILTSHFSQKTQDILYIVTSLVISLPLCIMLCIWSFDNAIRSTKIMEHSASAWGPPIWPVKLFMAFGFLFLVLQLGSNIIKKSSVFWEKKDKLSEASK